MKRPLMIGAMIGVSILGVLPPATAEGRSSAPVTAGTFPGANGLIAFQDWDGSDFEIYTVASNGTNLTQVTFNAVSDDAPRFSPDGSKIAWISEGQAWKMSSAGVNQQQVTSGLKSVYGVDWAPDGRRLVLSRDGVQGSKDLYLVKTNGTELVNITRTRQDEVSPSWSPTGRFIAYDRAVSGTTQVWRIRPNGEGARSITALPGPTYSGSWSPTGSHLLVSTNVGGDYELAQITSSGGGFTQLTDNAWEDEEPTYSPDGANVVWADNWDGDYEIVQAPLSSMGLPLQLTFNATNNFRSDWQPT